ncbi:MAG: hypothetical protein J5J06_01980 [Phycisphaerae bacterium]|nr:hypothetical protein [Phycisphaerae bacterium]
MVQAELQFGGVTADGTVMWRLPANNGERILVLTDDALYSAKLSEMEAERLVQELFLQNANVETCMKKATKIPHKRLHAVRGDGKTFKVSIAYMSLRRALTSNAVAVQQITVPDAAFLQEFFEIYRTRLGEKAKIKRDEFSPAKALVAPGVAAGCITFVTWFFAGGLASLDDGPPSGHHPDSADAILRISDALGPAAILSIGIMAIVACVFWAHYRWKNPPIVITLKPGKIKRKRRPEDNPSPQIQAP